MTSRASKPGKYFRLPAKVRAVVLVDLAGQLSRIMAQLGSMGLRSRPAKELFRKFLTTHPKVIEYFGSQPIPVIYWETVEQLVNEAMEVAKRLSPNGGKELLDEVAATQREAKRLAFDVFQKTDSDKTKLYSLEIASRAADRMAKLLGIDGNQATAQTDWAATLAEAQRRMHESTYPEGETHDG